MWDCFFFFFSFLGGFHRRWRDTSIIVGSPQTEPHSTWGPCSWFLRHLTWRPKQAVQGGPTEPHSFWRTSDSWSWRASMSGERREGGPAKASTLAGPQLTALPGISHPQHLCLKQGLMLQNRTKAFQNRRPHLMISHERGKVSGPGRVASVHGHPQRQ